MQMTRRGRYREEGAQKEPLAPDFSIPQREPVASKGLGCDPQLGYVRRGGGGWRRGGERRRRGLQ